MSAQTQTQYQALAGNRTPSEQRRLNAARRRAHNAHELATRKPTPENITRAAELAAGINRMAVAA
jgi:hypothetical protein